MLRMVDIESAWPHILPEAQRLLTDPEEAGPDDLLEAVRVGRAVCLRNDDGYLITYVKVRPRTGNRDYVIWWGSKLADGVGAFQRVLPEVRRAALALHCCNIVFYSSRPGWLRLAPRAGFTIRNVEYTLPVERAH